MENYEYLLGWLDKMVIYHIGENIIECYVFVCGIEGWTGSYLIQVIQEFSLSSPSPLTLVIVLFWFFMRNRMWTWNQCFSTSTEKSWVFLIPLGMSNLTQYWNICKRSKEYRQLPDTFSILNSANQMFVFWDQHLDGSQNFSLFGWCMWIYLVCSYFNNESHPRSVEFQTD